MCSDMAIKVESLRKRYEIYDAPIDRLKQMIVRKPYFREFWAINDISFAVNRGETVGIIGRNGSGKSTLLQMICGTLTPTTGSIQITGRIAALLELGAGFNPEFSGRENIYINAALLGLSKSETDECIAEIIAFSEIGDFINQPVKTYSSGMFTRLAFSVAIAVRPDILIVDEALSVGDVFFQQKCFERIRSLQKSGTTLLFVSHDPSSIKLLCDRSILLENGKIAAIGDTNFVINDYIRSLSKPDAGQGGEAAGSTKLEVKAKGGEYRYGSQDARVERVSIKVEEAEVKVVRLNQIFNVEIVVSFSNYCEAPVVGFYIKDKRGIEMYSGNTHYLDTVIGSKEAGDSIIAVFTQEANLAPGDYTLSVGVSNYIAGASTPLDRRYDLLKFSIVSDRVIIGVVDLKSTVKVSA